MNKKDLMDKKALIMSIRSEICKIDNQMEPLEILRRTKATELANIEIEIRNAKQEFGQRREVLFGRRFTEVAKQRLSQELFDSMLRETLASIKQEEGE